MIGQVFDVTKGSKHYGKGGGYNGFAGKDGSRAFVSGLLSRHSIFICSLFKQAHSLMFSQGKFDAEGLTPDVSGLKDADYGSLNEWLAFYRKDYKSCGKLIGQFYDSLGKATPAKEQFEISLEKSKKAAADDEAEKKEWPSCNSRWSEAVRRFLPSDNPNHFFSFRKDAAYGVRLKVVELVVTGSDVPARCSTRPLKKCAVSVPQTAGYLIPRSKSTMVVSPQQQSVVGPNEKS